jgi:hypothetical protein
MKVYLKKFTCDKYQVYCGKTVIARAYVDWPIDEIRILQGMPRMETITKIIAECPEYAKRYQLDGHKWPLLFSALKKVKLPNLSIVII